MQIIAVQASKYGWTVTIDGAVYQCPAVMSSADAIRAAKNAAQWKAYSAVRR